MKSLPAILASTWAEVSDLIPRPPLSCWAGNLADVQQLSMPAELCDPSKIEASLPVWQQPTQSAVCKRFLIFHAIKSGISSQTRQRCHVVTLNVCSNCSSSNSSRHSLGVRVEWPTKQMWDSRENCVCNLSVFNFRLQWEVIEIK